MSCAQYNKSEIRGERSSTRTDLYCKKTNKICDVNVDNTNKSKLVKIKSSSKYLVGHLDKAIRPLVLIMLKTSGYVKVFQDKEENNKLMTFCIDEDLKSINLLNAKVAIIQKLVN